MKKLNKIILPALAVAIVSAFAACTKNDPEPEVNHGYKTTIRVPDPDPLSKEDSAVVNAQQKEYDLNKGKKN